METNELLATRNETHGSFIVNSAVSQATKLLLRGELDIETLEATREYFKKGYDGLGLIHKEAYDHWCGKLGRIYAGQPTYNDHWEDQAGYMKLPVKFNHGKGETPEYTEESLMSQGLVNRKVWSDERIVTSKNTD